ncbi:MAG TPA: ATP-binding protein, partial [Solirubrobacteraceae bacterium]|nr:ATP-binding protein [Solirubrobacteraceae bacterium]
MLAIALGLKAVHTGHRVYYTTAADLVARTARTALDGRWQTAMRFWNGPQCSSSTNSATCRCPARPPATCSRSSHAGKAFLRDENA